MLQFFRKYQKVVFLFTTIVIVISFVFFGTFSNLMSQGVQVSDVEVAKMIDGSSLKKRKVQMMAHFLSANLEDSKGGEKIQLINLFNDGVLEKDILGTTLGKQLAAQYIGEYAQDVQERWQQAINFKPYVHPQATFISAESVWGSFEPSLTLVISHIKQNKTAAPVEEFSLLCNAYLKQRKIPSELMRRILFYQQNQASWASKDPKLENQDLALFGFHNAEEWLGSKYIELAGQFILNAAAEARHNGYSVSKQEARASLMENLSRGMKLMSEQSLSPEEMRNAFYQQIRILGIDEVSCVELWQDVLLFRKLFQKADTLVQVDSTLADEQLALAKKVSVIDLYDLPSALKVSDFRTLLKLQLYIDNLCPAKMRGDILSIPKEVFPVAEIEKRCPELVQKNYVVEFSEASKQDIFAEISLKQMWEWQLSEPQWQVLKQEFPILAKAKGGTREERFAALESLNAKQREQVDLFSQEKILYERPELVKLALQKAQRKTREVKLSIKGSSSPFALESHATLMSYLDKTAIPGTKNPTAEAIATQQKLLCYSEDGQHYYSITLLSRDDAKRVLTFAAASASGLLDQMLMKRLEEVYPDARRKEPSLFLAADGSYKPLKEVQDLVGRIAFADLLRAIDHEYAQHFGRQPSYEQKQSLSFYVTYRPLSFLKEARVSLEMHPDDPKWVALPENKSYQREIEKQWLLTKSQKRIPLSDTSLFISNDVLEMEEGSWSSIVTMKNSMLSFFRVVGKESASQIAPSEEKKIHEMVLAEAKMKLMENLLKKIAEKGSIQPLAKDSIAL